MDMKSCYNIILYTAHDMIQQSAVRLCHPKGTIARIGLLILSVSPFCFRFSSSSSVRMDSSTQIPDRAKPRTSRPPDQRPNPGTTLQVQRSQAD